LGGGGGLIQQQQASGKGRCRPAEQASGAGQRCSCRPAVKAGAIKNNDKEDAKTTWNALTLLHNAKYIMNDGMVRSGSILNT